MICLCFFSFDFFFVYLSSFSFIICFCFISYVSTIRNLGAIRRSDVDGCNSATLLMLATIQGTFIKTIIYCIII